MLQTLSLPSALVRSVAHVKGGTFMAIAACIVAASPSATFDDDTVAAWTGWDARIVQATRRAMRARGWLDDQDRLSGQAADLLLGVVTVDNSEEWFVKTCQYISERRGVRYKPTVSRRKDFLYLARKHGARKVYEVVRHRVNKFMTMTVEGKPMSQYARLETILRPSNFERYLSEYEDEQ